MITMQSSCLPHERKPCPGKIAKHFVAGSARNSLQLANELDIDWKTIDNHIERSSLGMGWSKKRWL
jgi:hypothetical protein